MYCTARLGLHNIHKHYAIHSWINATQHEHAFCIA
uniref:Uncharacterized protein n=1 Tax=Anguilla anguilla TaxID=7936 RepID=A0A0E9R2Y7_ANGAN